jgi:predicted transglutaminase-like cysteine proteinase
MPLVQRSANGPADLSGLPVEGMEMWGRSIVAGCVLTAACTGAAPSFAARTPATDSSYEEEYSYAQHASLFGSYEIYSQNTRRFRQWTDMLARAAAERKSAQGVCTSRAEAHCIPAEWQRLIERLRGLDLRHKIALVNRAMNRHPYVPTAVNWHRAMYWESPFEFLRHGGQCQDYAIAKYLLLRAAGVPAAQMRIVVLRDTAIDRDHAVLAVYVAGEPLLLDNLRADVVPAAAVQDYRPYYSINEKGWWTHFGGRAMTRVATNYR